MKNFKLLIIIVLALISVNCILIGILWYNNFNRRPALPANGQAFEYLTNKLALTPTQVKQYDMLRKQHFEFTSKIGGEQRAMRDSFFNNLNTASIDTAAQNALESRILKHQQMLDTATFNHFRKVRAMLTARQQAHFDDLIQDVLRMIGQPHPPGNGRGSGPAGMPSRSGVQDGPQQEPPPMQGQFKGEHRRPGMGGPQGPPPDGRPYGPPPPDGHFGPDGPPPQGPPPPNEPPPGPPQ